MPFRFDRKKALHVMLFMIHSLGGAVDISRLFLLLYLADLRHLAKYGSLITGDAYIAMKYGPVPFHILSIYKQLKEDGQESAELHRAKPLLMINEQQQAVALAPYDKNLLAESEVVCLFETLQENKAAPMELLCDKTMGEAWKGADINGEINLEDMAAESGGTPEMIAYIKSSYSSEINSFKHEHKDISDQER